MRFLLDANIPVSCKEIFHEFGCDALHVMEAGLSQAPDKDIIEFAVKNKRILVTKDIEFGNVLFYPLSTHHGVIILRLPFYFTAAKIKDVLKKFLAAAKPDEIENSITIIELGRYRTRK